MPYSKIRRVLTWILLSIVFIFLISSFLLNFYFDKRIISMLKEQVTTSSHGEYTLSLDDLSISFLNRSVTVENLIVAPSDQKADQSKAEYVFKAAKLKIMDISIMPYIKNKQLFIGRIEFEDPQISIYQGDERFPVKTAKEKKEDFSLYKAISAKFKSVSIEHIDIINSKLNIYRGTADTVALLAANENSISIKNFTVNEESEKMKRLFFADKFEVVMHNFAYHLKDGSYTFFGKKLYASYTDSLLNIDSVQLIPNFSKAEFSKATGGNQVSRIQLVASTVNLQKMDVKLFFELNWLNTHKVIIDGLNAEIFRDYNYPLAPTIRSSTQSLIREIPFLVAIDTIELKNSKAVYEELAPGGASTGSFVLAEMKGIITGLQNDTSAYSDESKLKIDLSTRFMNKGIFHVQCVFPLNTREELFYFNGSLSAMPITEINQMVEHTKKLSIKQGQLDSLHFSFTAKNNFSQGKMVMAYHDLSVDVMAADNDKKTTKEKLKNFLVNQVIIIKNNPEKNGKIRVVDIHAERNPYRYFPFFTMQSMLSGISASVEGEQKSKFLAKSGLLKKKKK